MELKWALDDNDAERMHDLVGRIREMHFRLAPQLRTKAADRVRLGFQRNFESESAGGEPWQALAAWTQEERRGLAKARGYPITAQHPILRRTGALRDSVVNKNSSLHICETSADWGGVEVSLGSADPRFPILHAGGINEDRYCVPARPMTVLSDADIAGLRSMLEWIVAEWAKAGF